MLKSVICIAALVPALLANATGYSVSVAKDGQTMVIVREQDGTTELFNIIERCGTPAVGKSKIRDLRIVDTQVQITYGKHCAAAFSLKTSQLSCSGCD
jgi:myo-inositol-hexaphosphate 3-phosphohydrolase